MTISRWVVFLSMIAFAYFARVVFIPVFLSIFLAMLFEPVVSRLGDFRLSRQRASTLVVLLFVIVSGVGLWYLYLSSMSLINDLSVSPRVASLADYIQRTAGSFESSTKTFFTFTASGAGADVQKVQLIENHPAWLDFMMSGFGSLFEIASVAIFVPLLLFYFLYDKENLVESANIILGRALYLPTLNSELPNMIRAFFVANIVTVAGLIATHAAMFYLLGFENWLPLSIISGFMNVLPLVGAPLAIVVPIGMGIMDPSIPFPYLYTVIFTLALHFIFNNLVLPVFIGSRININTVSLAVGLLFWSWLWGAVGFLIAIPMTALIKIFLESNTN